MVSWRRKRYTFICLLGFIAYILLVPRVYEIKFDATIEGADPVEVWEYVADFNNMMSLNPTILNFTITSDFGNYDNWQYGVHYIEHLSSFPFIKNAATAHFEVKKISNYYSIISKHRTCFFGNYFCLASLSKFIVEKDSNNLKNAYCQELIAYECPRIFSYVCHNEVMFQRKHIFRNLKKKLGKQLY